MAEARDRVYWDSCLFIAIFSAEVNRSDTCIPLFREASVRRTVSIVTSALTIAECAYGKGNYEAGEAIRAFFEDPCITIVAVDRMIAERARDVQQRCYRELGQSLGPRDAIHLATALDARVRASSLLTYDAKDLFPLSGHFLRPDGQPLTIKAPEYTGAQRLPGLD